MYQLNTANIILGDKALPAASLKTGSGAISINTHIQYHICDP
jgi:hypothetical protein